MDVAALLAQYLRASASGRMELVALNSWLFTSDVVEALNDAHDMLLQTEKQAKETCRDIDNVMDDIDLPSAPRLNETERSELVLTEETLISRFSEQLAALISQNVLWDQALQGVVLSCGEASAEGTLWHQQHAIVLGILSFLPTECTFNVAENVCSLWRRWLCVPTLSGAFWAGCVQREFSESLQTLLQLEGSDLYKNDWRTIAMVCCANNDESEMA